MASSTTNTKDTPKCPFCGRRNTVKKIEDKLFLCTFCQKMFHGKS